MKLAVTNLRTEYNKNPIGIEAAKPRLSWELKADGRNIIQKSYQIKCADNLDKLHKETGLIWNTGKIDSDKSIHVEYEGKALLTGQRVFWQVRIWDNRGGVSDWCDPEFWEMGLLNKSDWKASWIEANIEEDTSDSTPCPYLRKEFSLRSDIHKAIVYISSRGLYELSINGEKIGDRLFTPGWTSYHHRLQYQVYDVTEKLETETNALGVILGDGWYRGFIGWQGERNLYGDKPALLIQLKISYENGQEEWIVSDKSWKSNTGPILKSDIYNGETYDARQELTGWDRGGYDDKNWNSVFTKSYGYDNLVCNEGVPVRVTETIKPVDKIKTPRGETVFDLGQNITGWIQIRLKGRSGSKIVLNHAEVLDQEGNFYTQNLRSAKAEDSYIFNGNGIETWEPRFTFHGFRYLKVSGYDGEITINDIAGKVIHSDMRPTGKFKCSDKLINRLQKNIQWGLRGNFLDIPTDCPQRDERLGWTGDAQVFAPTACFNMDVSSFFSKWMKDFIVDQKNDGSVPWVVPNVIKNGGGTGWSDGYGSTGWADAAIIIPWVIYQVYGDKRILSEQYISMKAWVEYMITESGKSCIFSSGFHFGDWLSFAEYYSYNFNAPDYGYAGANTEKELIATAYFYYTTTLIQKIAAVLGKKNDAERYAALMPKIRSAFQNEFLTKSGRLTSNTQTAYVLALSFGLLNDDMVKIAARRLADDVNYFGHLTTGFLGTPLICQVLSDNGYQELAYKLLFNERYPSWLYPVTMGATTIWERWDGIKPDGSFQTERMNSFNHYAYGAVGNWLYSSVAGLKIDEDNPGYKKIIIKPFFTDRLSYAKAEYNSGYGMIVSHWERIGNKIKINVEIPVNTTALVCLPCSEKDKIFESNLQVKNVTDIVYKGILEKRIVFEVGSGKYTFKFTE